MTYDQYVKDGANVSTIAGVLNTAISTGNFYLGAPYTPNGCSLVAGNACKVGSVSDITLSPDGLIAYFVDIADPGTSDSSVTDAYNAFIFAVVLNSDVLGGTGNSPAQ